MSTVERLVPPLRRLPARWRMTLRGLTRNRRRSLLTVLGVAATASLVLVFAGLRDSIGLMFERQYGAVQREDAEVHVVPGAGDAVLTALRRDPGVAAAEPFARLDVILAHEQRQYQTLLMALLPATGMHGFTSDGRQRTLPADGLLLGEGMRDMLGIDEGDVITLTVVQTGQQSEQQVAGFVDEALNPIAYVSMAHLAQIAGTAQPSGVMLQLAPGTSEDDVRRRLSVLRGVAAYISTTAVAAAMRQAFSLYDALVGLMLVFAALMAGALLYNAMSANVAERSVELGTLRAAGMDARLLGRLVAAENLLLVILGLPLGIGAGVLIADWFMSLYETEGYQWHLSLSVATPLIVIGAVVLAALLAQLPALRAIRRLDVARIVRERSL
jgi:putative ABC transport system permease protein